MYVLLNVCFCYVMLCVDVMVMWSAYFINFTAACGVRVSDVSECSVCF